MSRYSKSFIRLKLVGKYGNPLELEPARKPVESKVLKIASSRELATMFRTSDRVRLDMIALAVNKDNIRISVH